MRNAEGSVLKYYLEGASFTGKSNNFYFPYSPDH
jgi:hypothetical protein